MTDPWENELDAYLDGDLGDDDRRAVEQQLADSAALREALMDRQALRRQLDELRDRPPSRDLWPGILARLGGGRRQLRAALLAAGLCGVLLGIGAGFVLFGGRADRVPSGQRFVLLLRMEERAGDDRTPEQRLRTVQRYRDWSRELARLGVVESGEKLAEAEGWLLRQGAEEQRGQFGGVAGYFVLRAADYDEALRLARTCPHLEHGSIELRRIEET